MMLVASVTFVLIRQAPGNPLATTFAGQALRANAAAQVGLDRPILVQYTDWLRHLARGELGESMVFRGQPVRALIFDAAAITLQIAVPALLLAAGLALGGAVLAAAASGRARRWAGGLAVLGIAIPVFVTAPFLALVIGVWLRVLPVAGYAPGDPTYLLMPILALALPLAASLYLVSTQALEEVLSHPSIRTARAKGLGRLHTVTGHAFRAAAIPVLSFAGPLVAATLLGSVVVESVFDIPGLGRVFLDAMTGRDYAVIAGTTLVTSATVILTNLVADLSYPLLDPRQGMTRETG